VGVFRENMAVPAGEDDRKAGISIPNGDCQLYAVHSKHDHVREDEVEGELVHGQCGQSRRGRRDPLDGVSEVPQQLRRKFSDILVIFDDEDPMSARSATRVRDTRNIILDFGFHNGTRQIDREGRTSPRARF
jgi:hypothetical protein